MWLAAIEKAWLCSALEENQSEASVSDGDVTLTFNRQGGFPAAGNQQLLVMFVRASRPGDPILAGVSTRREHLLLITGGKTPL